jgi:hypothetical protein
MRRESKYGTIKSIRFYQNLRHNSLLYYSYGALSLDNRNRWKLIDLLKEHSQSSNGVNKIVVRRNCNFYQYNGYRRELTDNPPKHRSFACKPNFVYQPYVKFIKVNQDIFTIALQDGFKFLKNENNLRQLLDSSSLDLSLTLVYFLDESKYGYSSDWSNAERHAFGGYLADYHMRCTGEYCPYGPKIRGQQTADPRIQQVLLFIAKSSQQERCDCYARGFWTRSVKPERHDYKRERSRLKAQ